MFPNNQLTTQLQVLPSDLKFLRDSLLPHNAALENTGHNRTDPATTEDPAGSLFSRSSAQVSRQPFYAVAAAAATASSFASSAAVQMGGIAEIRNSEVEKSLMEMLMGRRARGDKDDMEMVRMQGFISSKRFAFIKCIQYI